MKLKDALLSIISCALIATSAKAISIYTDLDVYNRLVTTTTPINDAFQISYQDADGNADLVGYNSATEQIYSATATFLLYDDDPLSLWDGSEKVTITLGPSMFLNNENALFQFAIGGVAGNALFDLDADGVLSYSIVATKGDFKAESGLLTVTAGPRLVPDGGTTALLLGMSFLGIYAAQRKFALAR